MIKYMLTFAVMLTFGFSTKAQYIMNTSFEYSSDGDINDDAPRFDAMVVERNVNCCDIGEFSKETGLEYWTADYSDGNGVCQPGQNFLHSPDWLKNGTFEYNQTNFDKYHGFNNGEILAHSGDGYIGLGQCELIQQKLAKKLKKNKTYYVEFFFRPVSGGFNRGGICGDTGGGPTRDHTFLKVYATKRKVKYSSLNPNSINEYCQKGGASWNSRREIASIDITENDYNFDAWNQFSESFTIPSKTYNWIVIEIEHNSAHGENSTYVYMDDFRIKDNPSSCGVGACIPNKTYVDNNIQDQTYVNDYILAHQNATVQNGRNVLFQARNDIRLEPNFRVELGAQFRAKIDDCSNAGNGLRIVNIPNIFTPNNDGHNDELCVKIDNALTYKLEIYNRWGSSIAQKSGNFVGNEACMWTGQSVSDGAYYMYLIVDNNCTEMDLKFWVQVDRDGRLRNVDSEDTQSTVSTNENVNIFPNPSSDGRFTLDVDGFSLNKRVQVWSLTGKLISELELDQDKVIIDLSNDPKGMYLIKVMDGTTELIKKVIYQ